VAAAFLAGGGTGPVLDVGAGTGLVGAALRGLGWAGEIDGIDLSPQMLDQAREKQVYRDLIEADVTRPLPLPGGYNGVVSSGTFTHGHVGPEALGPMLAVAAPGVLWQQARGQVRERVRVPVRLRRWVVGWCRCVARSARPRTFQPRRIAGG
jgi:SAM-dependent methyltransferase